MSRFNMPGVVEYVIKVETAFDRNRKVISLPLVEFTFSLFRILSKSRLFVLKIVDELV